MKKLSNTDILLLIGTLLVGIVIGIPLGYFGAKRNPEQVLTIDVSKHNLVIDSLYDIIVKSQKRSDSLESEIRKKVVSIENNHIKLASDVKKIHNFNDTTRSRFRDSVKIANSIK